MISKKNLFQNYIIRVPEAPNDNFGGSQMVWDPQEPQNWPRRPPPQRIPLWPIVCVCILGQFGVKKNGIASAEYCALTMHVLCREERVMKLLKDNNMDIVYVPGGRTAKS